jgi:hypothetical protein
MSSVLKNKNQKHMNSEQKYIDILLCICYIKLNKGTL